MKTFKDLIKTYGAKNLYKDLEIDRQVVNNWKLRNVIPNDRWPKLIVKARRRGIKLTYPLLYEMKENRV